MWYNPTDDYHWQAMIKMSCNKLSAAYVIRNQMNHEKSI